jgi:hypothetical protein
MPAIHTIERISHLLLLQKVSLHRDRRVIWRCRIRSAVARGYVLLRAWRAPLQPLQWSSAARDPDDRSAKQCRAGNRMRIGLLSRPVVGGTVAGSMMAERAAPASDRHERVRMAGCRAEAGGRGGGASGPFPVSTASPRKDIII